MSSGICDVFRSPRREGMYLYVLRSDGLARVPDALLSVFGEPEPALSFVLEPGRKLARADATRVLEALNEQGYYLQRPPEPGARDQEE